MYESRATPVHRSLLEYKTIGGVESRMAILNGTVAAAITLGTETLLYIPVAMVLHMMLRWLTKKDPHLIMIYMRYRLLGDVYDPWVRRSTKTNARPKGFSRGVLC